MAGTGRKNANLMNLIKRVHGVVENTDIEKHRQSQDHFGALLGNNKDVIFEDVQIQALTGSDASAGREEYIHGEWTSVNRAHMKKYVILILVRLFVIP